MSAEGLLYLTRADLDSLALDMRDIVAAVDEGCRRKGRGEVVMPPKLTLHRGGGAFSQVMAAAVGEDGAEGVKWVTICPQNTAVGLPLVNGLVMLSEPVHGRPVAILDAATITAWRTGAGAAVAARYLARSDATSLAVVGCGVQGASSVRALAAEMPLLRTVRCLDAMAGRATAFAAELEAALPGLCFTVCRTPEDTVRGAGVVVTAITMSEERKPPLKAGLLEPGALAVALDYDAAWSDEAMAECDRFYCDDLATVTATRESGRRLTGTPPVAADLGQLAAGGAAGRKDADERLFCMNLGMAVEDVVTAELAYERARRLGVGTLLPV